MLETYTDLEQKIEDDLALMKKSLGGGNTATASSTTTSLEASAASGSNAAMRGLEARIVELESRLAQSEARNVALSDELGAVKVSLASRMDERILAMSRDLHTEVGMVQTTLEATFDAFVRGAKQAEIETQEKIWELEKALEKIEGTGVQMMSISEEYMLTAQQGHQKQLEHSRNLERLIQQRRDEVSAVLEQLANSVAAAELQIVTVAKELERYKGLDSMKHMAHLQAEFSHKMKEMTKSLRELEGEKEVMLRSLQGKAAVNQETIIRVVQAQTKELSERLDSIDGGATASRGRKAVEDSTATVEDTNTRSRNFKDAAQKRITVDLADKRVKR